MKIGVEIPVTRTARVMQVEGMFDVPPSEHSKLSWELPDDLLAVAELEQDRIDVAEATAMASWNVGLIVGPSGSGKTTVARALWPEQVAASVDWPEDRSVLDAFDPSMSVKDVVGLLGAVGFGSPPSWLRPFHVLSTGEQFRATLARLLATDADPIVMDEFTSPVDRRVAQIGSHTVQKTVRAAARRFVAVTPHEDVADWLQPDWVYRPDSNDFEWRRLQRHPELHFDVAGCERSVWARFRRHHYLSGDLHVAARCFAAYFEEEPVAFCAVYKIPHPKVKNITTIHRIVVLPDWQGIGLGRRLCEAVAARQKAYGYRTRITLAHPTLIRAMAASDLWKLDGRSNKPVAAGTKPKRLVKQHANPRKLATRAFEYVGS
jgi:GNAT superfamily N-acetyltransferase